MIAPNHSARLVLALVLLTNTFIASAQPALSYSDGADSASAPQASAPPAQLALLQEQPAVAPEASAASPNPVPIDRFFGNLPVARFFMATAVAWPNGKLYFFSGNGYVAYPVSREGVLAGYPKYTALHPSNWPGLDQLLGWKMDGQMYQWLGYAYELPDVQLLGKRVH